LQEEANFGSAAEGAPPLPALSPARRGYLHCQLQMGHLQGMLTQVDGFAQSAAGGSLRPLIRHWLLVHGLF